MKKLLLFACVLGMSVALMAQTFPSAGFFTTDATNTDQWVEPVGAQFSKDGMQLFIWEKRGRLYVNNRQPSGQYNKQILPVIDISDEVGNWFDCGLLGFTYDPNFTSNGYIYLYYVVDRHHLVTGGLASNGYNPNSNDYNSATIGRITRYTTSTVSGNLVADKATRKVLLGESKTTGIPILHKSHSVGSLAFAADGTLLVTSGDGASYDDTDVGAATNNDPNINTNTYYQDALADGIISRYEDVGAFRSQMLNSLSGKLLRLDAETGDGIASNPFFDPTLPRSAKSRVWALGLRNPFRMSVKPGTGSTNPSAGDIGEVFVGDVGYGQSEELNIVKAPGQNFGWPIYEGNGPSADPGKSYWGYIYTKNREELRPICDGRDTMFFHELIRQDNAAKATDIYSDCSPYEFLRSGIRYIHARPAIDWAHVPGKVFVPRFNAAGEAIPALIGSPESNVVATTDFEGNASTGGIWYTGAGNSFPPEYKNTFLVSDFGGRWIRRLGIDFTDVVTTVDDFATDIGGVVSMTENPIDGS
ncbi:MAG: PQQ-dependent sugar dehydrogenase, partial [Chitinophagaceae bacterium]